MTDIRDFRSLERDADQRAMFRYLDSVRGLAAAKEYKDQTFELLDIAPGQILLEVGCGTGDDARVLADRVGPSGRVVAVDISEAAIAEAIKRSASSIGPVEFRLGDALALDFPDNHFDGARADRVLQHVEDPVRALQELVRVTRPGGKVVVMDPDWDTLAIDSPDRETTRNVVWTNAENVRNCWMGRELRSMFLHVGLEQVEVHAHVALFTDFQLAKQLVWLDSSATQAVSLNRITATQATDWLNQLEAADRAGAFFASLNGYITAGRKPQV